MAFGPKETLYPSMSLGELEARGLVSLGRGKVISKHDLAAIPGTFPVYSSAKDNDGKFGEYGEFMFDEELITWSVDGGGRLFHRPKHRFSVTNVGGTLRVNDSKLLDCRFLFFMLSHLHSIVVFDWVQKAHPSVIRKVYDTLPLPPLEEQRRIVAVLDEAFAAIALATANAKKNLANAEEMFDGYQRNFFIKLGAKTKPLGELATFRNGLNFTGSSKGEIIRIVGVGDFQKNLHVPTGGLATVQIDGVLAPIDLLAEGDILSVRSNGNKALIGRCMIAGKQSERTSHSGFTIRIRPNQASINPSFLCRVLKSPTIREQLVAGGAGANISSLNQGALACLSIPILPFEHQRKTVADFAKTEFETEKLTHVIRKKIEALNTLKQSLLHRAFTGELTAAAKLATNDNSFKTPAFAANVIAFAYRHHRALGTENTFGHVKAQKALHLCESVGMVDLGRNPIKDAAGPNDFPHMLAAEDWAKANRFFEFAPRPTGGGYIFKKLDRFDAIVAEWIPALLPVQDRLEKAVALIAPMDSEEAELLATVHAAWNNLVLNGTEPTDAAIIYEARENWHDSKLKFANSKFQKAIATIRAKGVIPDGTAKRVSGQDRLL